MKQSGVKIEGVIYSLEGDLGHNKFLDEFLEFIESKGWQFGGGSFQVDEEGKHIDDIDD
ncbi:MULTISPECIES: hypothetical protein [Bacillus]|uniref:Uncharacterized protein n=1 Tax=Bacillus atrophaeus (strain 1942) TaxID=720555 RepID=A0ABM5LT60_BACA1|nr:MULTISPECIES: hypothetical protein [Bacillus]ADP30987.1 hypothetical protein BATR1942_00135 [Bacillus atrophaeus 1942]AIK45691.1 hypothetical protein DJ95_4162 [Bacillus atrophaeus subsp. globigii]EIM09552.1 hypothetical protein UY9_16746 [Bacillus atrophaeus C89]KFK84776.1 hypothetical protein DK44_3978 [Bacillus atrophaeus]MBZ6489883.1 hypothetical protein [Bacillus subtilis subsp. subtilis]